MYIWTGASSREFRMAVSTKAWNNIEELKPQSCPVSMWVMEKSSSICCYCLLSLLCIIFLNWLITFIIASHVTEGLWSLLNAIVYKQTKYISHEDFITSSQIVNYTIVFSISVQISSAVRLCEVWACDKSRLE